MKEDRLKHFLTHQAFKEGGGLAGGAIKPTKPPKTATREQVEQYNRDLADYNNEEKSARTRKSGFNPVDDPAETERRYLQHQAEWLPKKQEADKLKNDAFLRARDAYDEKMGGGRSMFRKINNALIDIADHGVNLPFVPPIVKDIYQEWGPKRFGGALDEPAKGKKKKVTIGCACGCGYCENKK